MLVPVLDPLYADKGIFQKDMNIALNNFYAFCGFMVWHGMGSLTLLNMRMAKSIYRHKL